MKITQLSEILGLSSEKWCISQKSKNYNNDREIEDFSD